MQKTIDYEFREDILSYDKVCKNTNINNAKFCYFLADNFNSVYFAQAFLDSLNFSNNQSLESWKLENSELYNNIKNKEEFERIITKCLKLVNDNYKINVNIYDDIILKIQDFINNNTDLVIPDDLIYGKPVDILELIIRKLSMTMKMNKKQLNYSDQEKLANLVNRLRCLERNIKYILFSFKMLNLYKKEDNEEMIDINMMKDLLVMLEKKNTYYKQGIEQLCNSIDEIKELI